MQLLQGRRCQRPAIGPSPCTPPSLWGREKVGPAGVRRTYLHLKAACVQLRPCLTPPPSFCSTFWHVIVSRPPCLDVDLWLLLFFSSIQLPVAPSTLAFTDTLLPSTIPAWALRMWRWRTTVARRGLRVRRVRRVRRRVRRDKGPGPAVCPLWGLAEGGTTPLPSLSRASPHVPDPTACSPRCTYVTCVLAHHYWSRCLLLAHCGVVPTPFQHPIRLLPALCPHPPPPYTPCTPYAFASSHWF